MIIAVAKVFILQRIGQPTGASCLPCYVQYSVQGTGVTEYATLQTSIKKVQIFFQHHMNLKILKQITGFDSITIT